MSEIEKEIREASPQHASCFDAFKIGKNLFITGSAGTGKTELIKNIKDYCIFNNIVIMLCSTTGASALRIEGKTLHSTFKFPIKNYIFADICQDYQGRLQTWKKSAKDAKRDHWISTIRESDWLIIDEISMCSAWFFNMINYICQILREKVEPFGGLKLVCVGDFLQLQPVYNAKEIPAPDIRCGCYAFESPFWNEMKIETHRLIKCFRQKETKFAEIVRKIGYAETLSPEENGLLESRMNRDLTSANNVSEVIYLSLKNATVKMRNDSCYNQLIKNNEDNEDNEQKYRIPLTHSQDIKNEEYKYLLKDVKDALTIDGEEQKFVTGARVMCVVNNTKLMLSNGDLGSIIDFQTIENADVKFDNKFNDMIFPLVEFDNGETHLIIPHTWDRTKLINHGGKKKIEKKIVATIDAIPLKLAWASTIHKMQGVTIPKECKVEIDTESLWMNAVYYVAISRCQTLDQFVFKR